MSRKSEFSAGDLVELKSGSPPLLVTDEHGTFMGNSLFLDKRQVDVTWIDNKGRPHERTYNVEFVKKVKP